MDDVNRSFISPRFCPQNHRKKGQVTIFIILGIILLIVIALLILFRKEIVTFKPEEIAPTEKGKIENFVRSCIAQLGEEALTKLGLQAGYVNVPEEIAADGSRHLRTSPFTVIPYWAYGEIKNVPSLSYMEEEVDRYLEENLQNCLFALNPFQEAYTLVEKSPITAETDAAKNRILFNVHWDIEIRDKAGEVITEIIDHTAESSVKLRKIHALAERVVDTELRDLKFEDITQDLIALEHPNVPVVGMEFSCKEKRWAIRDVKQTLQNLLRTNIREMKIKGSEAVEFPEELPYYQNHYVWDLGEGFDASNLAIDFDVEDNYPFVFEVSPRSGTTLKSNTLGGNSVLLSAFCMQAWKFVYDVSFPIVATIRDETTGYTFKMAFTVHLQKNIPNRKDVISARKTTFLDAVDDEEYCRERIIPMLVSTSELVENEQTGIFDKNPVEDVAVTFTCLRYACDIGMTEYNFAGMGDIAAYRTNFPYCAGGIVRGEKAGYKEAWERVATEPGKEVELALTPLFSFPVNKIKVLKHEFASPQQIGPGVELQKDETALIKVTYRKAADPAATPFHEDNTVYGTALDPEMLKQETLDLLAKADFTYQLDISVLDNEQFIGGYKANWTVSWNDLQNAQGIIFHVASKERASDEQQFALLLELEQNSAFIANPEVR